MTKKSPDYDTIDEARQAGLILSATREVESAYIRENEDGTWYIDDEPPAPPDHDDFFIW